MVDMFVTRNMKLDEYYKHKYKNFSQVQMLSLNSDKHWHNVYFKEFV